MKHELERWKSADRITHWLLLVGFILTTLTGLVLFDSKTFGFLRGLTEIPSPPALPGRSGIHTLGAILIGLGALIHAARRAGNLKTEIVPTSRDVSDLMRITAINIGSKAEYPRIGFHHPGEKFLYWTLGVAGFLLLGASGLIMWFPGGSPSAIHTWAVTAHYLSFALISVLLIGHLMLSLHPANREALRAMLRNGRVSTKWAKEHHPAWLEEKAKA